MRVLAISGSLRSGAYSTRLAEAAAELLPAEAVLELYGGLASIPNYDQDVEDAAAPEAAEDLRQRIDEADALLADLEGNADAIFVDFHAEVTSEKVALGWYLDGRVAAVCGTHTHVPTADGRVLPGGTAFISDVGMTGARESVLGVKKEQAIERMRTEMPVRFETATEDVWVMGAAIEINAEGLADSIEPFLIPAA